MTSTAPATARLLKLLQHLPTAQHALAYGSGVFHQPDLYKAGDSSGPMIDFILSVDDPVAWHDQNIKRNPSHYSFMEWLGPAAVAGLASQVGAGVYFNTLVPVEGQLIKYGVISTSEAVDDLLTWRHLYVAGRLHKPVCTLVEQPQVQAANQANMQAAVATALLLSGPTFSTKEVLQHVCSLSYTGDVRMGLAEDGSKVARIVQGSWQGLRDLYTPLLVAQAVTQAAEVQQVEPELWQQRVCHDSKVALLASLPAGLLHQLAALTGCRQQQHMQLAELGADIKGRQEVAHAVVKGRQDALLRQGLGRLVGASSKRQAVAGVLMAGPVRAVKYLCAKVAKAWQSKSKAA